MDAFNKLLASMTATPNLDKLHKWASNVKLDESFVEEERKFAAKHDAYWEARAADRDEGEEVAA